MTASIWSPGSIVGIETINADNTRKSQRFAPNLVGTTVFTITNFAYAVGTGSLNVVINGVTQYPGTDFIETSPSSFTLTTPVEAEDIVDVYGMVGSPAAQSAAVSAAAAIVASSGAADSATAANASAASASVSSLSATSSAIASAGSALDSQHYAQQAANSAGAATNTQVNSDLAVTDSTLKSYVKNQTAIVANAVLTGLNTALSGVIATSDNIISALSKLQNAITNLNVMKADHATTLGGYGITDAVKLNTTNASIGTRLASGSPPNIANISASNNQDSVALIISNAANTTASSVIQFLRGNQFAAFFGVDTDNKLKFGGYSLGAVAYDVYHAGNPQPGVLNTTGGQLTGQLIGKQGTASSPAFAFTGDGDSGFYSLGDGNVSLSVNAVPIISINPGAINMYGALNLDSSAQGSGATHVISNTNGLQILLRGSGNNPGKTIRVLNGTIDIVNSAYSASILNINDSGDVYISGNLSANSVTSRA